MDKLLEIIKNLDNDHDLEDFMVGILTPQEIEQILIRINIIKLLKKGIPQHTIASRLEIGVGTVSRGAKMLKQGRFKYIK